MAREHQERRSCPKSPSSVAVGTRREPEPDKSRWTSRPHFPSRCCCSGIPSSVPTGPILLRCFTPFPQQPLCPGSDSWLVFGCRDLGFWDLGCSSLLWRWTRARKRRVFQAGFLPRFVNILICLFCLFLLECFPCGMRNGCAGIAAAAPALGLLVPRASGCLCAGVFGTRLRALCQH